MTIKKNFRFNRLETDFNHYYNNTFGSENAGSHKYSGFIKCKLAHRENPNFSIIIPDLIILSSKTSTFWIQPLAFLPCTLFKFDDEVKCNLLIDIPFGNTLNDSTAKTIFC